MKKRGYFLLFVFLIAGILYAAPIQESSGGIGKNGELVLLHSNDFHGALLATDGRPIIAEMATVVNVVRVVNPQVLLVDAGDFNTGSALSNMFDAEPGIRAYNIMGYDAVTFGNHEFDSTLEKLDKQIGLADFPFVSSNIKKQDGSYLGGNRYLVKQYNNFTVGIFGITTLRTLTIASPDKSLVFINEIEAAREVVDILRNQEKVDIIIGLTHMGDVKEAEDHITSIELASAVEGIDVIVDAHSHSFFEIPKRIENTWIVSANEMGKFLGFGRLVVRNGKLADFGWVSVAVRPDVDIEKMLKPYVEKAGVVLKEVIGEASDDFIIGNRLTRYQETAIGNLVTDANAWYLRNISRQQIDFVLHNGGNIRAELKKGPITQENVLTVLPFENYLFVASMKGSQLIKLFDFIATIPQGNGGFAQFSSDVQLTIDKTSGGGTVKDLTIGGEPIDPDRVYRFCTNDYILGGGDGYTPMLEATDKLNTSVLLSYVVTEYIKANKSIKPETDGRLTIIGGVKN
jgi:5'-nucleotidase/UDP-sugar diphosphatase